MSRISVSEYRNKFNIDRMLRDIPNRNSNDMSSSSDNKSSNIEAIKSSNCVINIDYVVQEEKISFEVFRSSIDSCVFCKKFSLRQSKSCTHLTSLEKLQLPKFHVNNKMVQTEGQLRAAILPPDNIGPPPFSRSFECPVKDTPTSNDISYKETYDVSNFKFPENPAIVKLQHSNFCCLDFDGTRSTKRNNELHRTKNKQTIHVKRVRSDINMIKKSRMYSPSPFRGLSPSPFTARQNIVAQSVYDVEKLAETKTELNKEILDSFKHKKKKHRVVENDSNSNTIELNKDERAAFEFVLSPKEDEENKQTIDDKEKNEHRHKHRHRKIIVTSNTLEPSLLKPKMKDEQQQTNYHDLINLDSTSVNELYLKPNFRSTSVENSLNSGDQNTSHKKKKRDKKKKMAMNVFPCVDIKGSQQLEMSVNQKRPTIPRRRIDGTSDSQAFESNKTDLQSALSTIQSLGDSSSITSKRKEIPRKSLKIEENPRDPSPPKSPKDENTKLREKISNLFKNEHPTSNTEYNKKIDELCGLINNLVQERDRSRSRFPSKLRNTNTPSKSEPPTRQNSFKKESTKPENKISKVDRLKIIHNKRDSVTIMDTINKDTTKQNTVPRTVLQVSPRANEILHSSDFKRKNSMVTYPVNIMPQETRLEQDDINNEVPDATLPPGINNKPAQQINKSPRKSTETKRNCSSVTFSSQIAIIGDDSHFYNDPINVKNTLFSINDNFKRSKTLPTKQDFCKSTSSRNSTVASSVICEMPSSVSNSDLNSLPEGKCKEKAEKKRANKANKQKPGAIENCTFMSARTNQLSKNRHSSFQKRKEYYLNLKMKMKKQEADVENKIEESPLPTETKLVEDKPATNATLTITPDSPKPNTRSKSKIPLYKRTSKREISPKDFILKTKKEPSVFPYEFSARDCGEDDHLNRSSINAYPLEADPTFPKNAEKLVSPYKVGDVKQQISTFLQSYPLEINTPPTSARPGPKPKNATLSLKVRTLTSIIESSDSSEESIKSVEEEIIIPEQKPKQHPKEYSLKRVISPNKITKPKITRTNNGKKIYSSKLSSKTVTMYRAPRAFKSSSQDVGYLSVILNKKDSFHNKYKKSKLPVRTKQINETDSSKHIYYSIKPSDHTQHHHQPDEDSELCDLAKACAHFCCFDCRASKNSSLFTESKCNETTQTPEPQVSPKNKTKTEKKVTSKQINEDNTPAVYQYYNHYVDDRYIHGQQVPTCCDLGKVCKYFCCPDNRPTREESDFELSKDIEVVERPKLVPTITPFGPVVMGPQSVDYPPGTSLLKRLSTGPTGTAGPTIIRPTPTGTAGPTIIRPTPSGTAGPTIIRPTPTGTAGPTIIRPTRTGTAGPTIIRPTPTGTAGPTIIRPTSTGTAGPTKIKPAPTEIAGPSKIRRASDKKQASFFVNTDHACSCSTQICENNSQLVFHSRLEIKPEPRPVYPSREPLLADFGKVCRHFCCLDEPSPEVSEFKLVKNVEQSKIQRTRKHKHPLWNLLPRKSLITPIPEDAKVENFPSSSYKLPLDIQPEIPLNIRNKFDEKPANRRNEILIVTNRKIQTENSSKMRNQFVIQSSQISEIASNISNMSNSADSSFKIALDSLLLLPKETSNESKRKDSFSECSIKKKSKIEEIPIDVILTKNTFFSKSEFESKYSEFDLVCKTSSSNVENLSQKSSSDISVKKSLSRKYLRLLKIDSFTNFIRKKTTAFKKIVSSKKDETKDK